MIVEVKVDNLELIKELEKNFNDVIKDVLKDFKDNPFTHYIVYLDKNKILGFINYYLIYDRIEIVNFNVLESFQNQGIGTKLLEFLIKIENIKNITLEVKCDNKKAISLYHKLGFVAKAKRKGYYQGIDGILMERKSQ